jgi:hypothetical protein
VSLEGEEVEAGWFGRGGEGGDGYFETSLVEVTSRAAFIIWDSNLISHSVCFSLTHTNFYVLSSALLFALCEPELHSLRLI